MSGARPPKLLERLLEWVLPTGLSGQSTLGDLAEGFEQRACTSPVRARIWYATQTASLMAYRVFSRGGDSALGGSDLVTDFRWSARTIAKHPGFSIGVVAVLGLGLGANTAVFSVVDGTLRNSSWWSDPDATVSVWPDHLFSFGNVELYKEEQAVYRTLGAYIELAFAVQTPDGESESVNGVSISPKLFRELSSQPAIGRGLVEEEALLGTAPVVVVGEAFWRRSLGANPGIVGSTIIISGTAVTVVGVQSAGALAPGGRAELWFPFIMDPRDDDYWRAQNATMVGVLRDGATLADASVDLDRYTARLSQLFPMFYPPGFADGLATVARADETHRRMISTPLLLLLGGTALLMLVTALNVGNLLLGRSIDRRKELAVRGALGAARGRIVRQLLVEGLVLTLLALGVGLLTGSLGGGWIAGLFVGETVVASSSVLTPSVFMFALSVSALAWLVLNGVPIAHYLKTQWAGPTVSPDTGSGVQRSLVAVQASLATLLLVSATLLVATVDNLRNVPVVSRHPGSLP